MAKRQSKRQASQKATAGIKASFLKSTKVSGTKRPADATKSESKVTYNASKATEARMLISAIQHADDPIRCFDEWEDCERRLLIEDLLLSHRKLAGFPRADQALASEAKLLEGEQLIMDDDESDTDEDRRDKFLTMHGELCRSPPATTGICSRPVTVDMDGYVDLQHDAYCLSKHFTTQWGIPMNQNLMEDWRRAHNPKHRWSDWDWRFEAEGKHPGLRVDFSKVSGCSDTDLHELISSQLLLYRIVTNFGSPPWTEK
ncbi:hypothetical protein F5883DRAFT_179304 [Diaporthe sp. PMI_573]|nr:hypothetical protein F5883DRAFT_179304 [Diaporthaceae sp. PMI_573]